MQRRSLNGEWQFRFEDEDGWRTLAVPGCWETLPVSKARVGPAIYRTTVDLLPVPDGGRLWLRFGGVSYACTVFIDGQEVGAHTGLWDAFSIEIPSSLATKGAVELMVRVEKPASLTAGPGSARVAGTHPMPETLSGFLPYVWGQIFGGIWQDVDLVSTGQVVIEDVYVAGDADGHVTVEATLSGPAQVALTLTAPDGTTLYAESSDGTAQPHFSTTLPDPQPWSPDNPTLYTAHLRVAESDERTIRFGLRTLAADGTRLLLNGQPVYPRMALSWGWYAEALHSNPGPERVRADFERLQRLGYNGVKLCLWYPPQYYFDLADEMGMLLWLELPMWMPDPSPFFREQMPHEYERLVRQARNHPSLIVYSLGCELNHTIGPDILAPLYAMVKSLTGDALVRDNSGSGEAYGGLLNEFADFYDYHFYTDIQFYRELIDYFTPRWRPVKPWLFGEYCDLDTFRDLRRLGAERDERPWWTTNDPVLNPQGARWQFDIVEQEDRLRANGMWERGAELEHISERQSLLHRKFTLEATRSYAEISGYVITGEVDTPISTAGMWDDQGRVKLAVEDFRAFNDDVVVLLGWDKRRDWIAGGDRAAYWDTWSHRSGDAVRAHLIASHFGTQAAPAHLDWTVAFPGEESFAAAEHHTTVPIQPGDVREIVVAEFITPDAATPRIATLHARLQLGGHTTANSWQLYLFPHDTWRDTGDVIVIDPARRLHDLSVPGAQVQPTLAADTPHSTLLLTTTWNAQIKSFVEAGGRAVVLTGDDAAFDMLPVVAMPFWREAVRVIEPHPAWGDFPHDGYAALQFYGCATDRALDTATLGADAQPILRRVDARTMQIHDYATEITLGRGRVIVSTLRFEGGLGDQPLGISRNTAAAYLLACWLRYLRGSR